MFKVKSVLRGQQKDWISALESQVSINPAQDLFNDNVPNALEVLFESIAEKKQVQMDYRSLQVENPVMRVIEPVGLFHENNYWYVYGYCHLREDYRQFRTDRITRISRTQTTFFREHPSLQELRTPTEDLPRTKVRILVDRKVARFMGSGRKYQGFVSQKSRGDWIEMTFMSPDLKNGFARWYLMFGDYAKIIEPESLKNIVRDLLKRMEVGL
ncbi:MAG: WYL domain-containing protein [Bacteroidota bacterium]